VRVVCAVLLLLLLPVGARSTAYAAPGGLGVRLINGTPGAAGTVDLPLTVYQVDGTTLQPVAAGRSDTQSAFEWAALSGPVDARYVISTTYQGVAYRTDPATLPAPAVTLRVYEATDDDTAIRIATAGQVIVSVDADRQQITVLETITLRNSGPRTFRPSTAGPRGPMGLLRFGLPGGAGNLTPDSRLAGQSVIQVNTGFATDLPLPPGDTTVGYRYDVAYGALEEGGYAALTKTLPYTVDQVRVLAPPAAYTLRSPQLGAATTTTVGSRTYRLLQGTDLPPHSEVTVELRNLPLNQPLLRPSNPWLQGIVGLLLLGAVSLPLGYRRRRGPAL